MLYRFLPPNSFILDAFVAAVLLRILGLTSSFFIQALVDCVFVRGRNPALKPLGLGMLLDTLARARFRDPRSCLLPHHSQRIDAERVLGRYSHPLGLPPSLNHFNRKQVCVLSLSDPRTFFVLLILLGVAASTYLLTMDVSLPDPGDLLVQDGPVPIVIEASGRIRDVYITEGSGVHVGDLLLQLDTSELLRRKLALESKIHSVELQRTATDLDLSTLYRELRQLQMDMDRFTITSPAEGQVVSLEPLHAGNTLPMGIAIAVVVPRKVAPD